MTSVGRRRWTYEEEEPGQRKVPQEKKEDTMEVIRDSVSSSKRLEVSRWKVKATIPISLVLTRSPKRTLVFGRFSRAFASCRKPNPLNHLPPGVPSVTECPNQPVRLIDDGFHPLSSVTCASETE